MRCPSEEIPTTLEGKYRWRQEGTGHGLQPVQSNVLGTKTVSQLLDEPLSAISETPLIRFRSSRPVFRSELDAHRTLAGSREVRET